MKFLFLSSFAHLALDPDAREVSGGAELQVALLAAELVKLGHDAVIVGGDHGQPDRRTLRGVRTRLGGKFHTGRLLDTLLALPRVLGILARERPDYAVILGWTTWLFFLQVLKPLLRTRLIFICGLDTEVNGEFRRQNPWRGALFEYGVRHAAVRFAMTEDQRQQFHRAGLDCGLYRNLILPRATPATAVKDIDFLWVARCQPIKRPYRFLDLVWRTPEARCVMICPNEDRTLRDTLEVCSRLFPNLELLERVPYHEIQNYYDRASIFVNTSEAEGFPNSFIQAAMGGAAILSMAVDPDKVLARFGGGVCAGGNDEEFFAAAARLRSDPGLLGQHQSQASRFVTELHDTTKNVDAFLAGLPRCRVLHVIDSFDLGGAQTALLNLIKYADRERFELEVACLHGRGVFWRDFVALGVPVHSLSPAKWLPLYVPRLLRLLATRRFDVVHCHLFGANWIAKPLAALLRVPVIVAHDQCNDRLRHESAPARWLDTLTNRLSTHICAVSRSTRDFLLTREGLPEARVSVVHNGVDLERFTPAKADAHKNAGLLVIGVGRLHPQKNFALFLEVAAEVAARHPGVRFAIAGAGPEEAALKRQASALDVLFSGHVADMRGFYAAADVLLLTSRYEGTPLTVLEAMAVGVPVVASKVDGIEELIADGADGFLVAPDDRALFVDRVAELLAKPELRARFAAAAREKVEASFSARAMAAQVESIYLQ